MDDDRVGDILKIHTQPINLQQIRIYIIHGFSFVVSHLDSCTQQIKVIFRQKYPKNNQYFYIV